MEYKFEFDRVIEEIRKSNAKRVLVQLPDGLRPQAQRIHEKLKDDAEIVFWLGTCFGACDLPDVKGFDLLVHFGHTEWG